MYIIQGNNICELASRIYRRGCLEIYLLSKMRGTEKYLYDS